MQLPHHGGHLRRSLFLGTFVHCKSLSCLEILCDTAVFVDENGKIVGIKEGFQERDEAMVESLVGWKRGDYVVKKTGDDEFYFPGFIDTHLHASQYPNAGLFGESTLLDWLQNYTFPMEASMSCLSRAKKVYSRCVSQTIQNGTTTASYFATIDVAATNLLADICQAAGQRAFIGRVCMDRLGPDYYLDESVEECLRSTKACIEHIRCGGHKYDLISPIITPRFAPACTSEMMFALGVLGNETNLPFQTHIAENKAEVELVKELFPGSKSYADVYDTHNLLTEKTILAHAVHLSQEELDLIKKRNSKIAHCPASNSALTSGTAKVRWMLDCGVDVGLGTDMAGGYSISILEAVRQALLVSRHVAMNIEDEKEKERVKLKVKECLWLATRGGAKVVGLEDRVGGFEVGMEWDAQLIGLGMVSDKETVLDSRSRDHGPVDIFGWEEWEERVEKWVYAGDDRNTRKVWVKGKLVHERERV